MSYKSILVHVETIARSDSRLRAAASFARSFGAAVIGLGGREPAVLDNPLIAAFGDGAATQACVQEETRDLVLAEARFRRIIGEFGSPASWRAEPVYPVDGLQMLAAGADLIVASAGSGPHASTASAADLVLRSGLPVLVTPAGVGAVSTSRILIAWKNTREARRAVSDALPLLARAAEVIILNVESRSEPAADPASLADLCSRLERHGVRADAQRASAHHGDAAAELLRFAASERADLIVAGAYGRPRAGEWLLGGMTERLLGAAPLPILFSH